MKKRKTKENEVRKSLYFNIIEVIVIILIVTIVVSLTTGIVVYKNYDKLIVLTEGNGKGKNSSLAEFIKTYSDVKNNYLEEVDDDKLIDSAIQGMYSYLEDEYSIYLDNTSAESLEEELEGKYVGLGIQIYLDCNGTFVINKIMDNSPASKTDLKEGDVITFIDGNDLTGKDMNYFVSIVKNNGIKTHELTYIRDSETYKVNITSNEVYLDSIYYLVDGDILTLQITTFSETTEEQIKNVLDKLDSNINKIIIDVRGNTGGYLTSASNIVDLFVEKGSIIYQLKNKSNKITKYKAKSGVYKKFDQIVVLINGTSASASEILALSLKENVNATIVGTQSYGKGTVQETSKLSSGAMVKYTTSYWLSPKGNSIDKIGIVPDVKIEENEDALTKAKEILK